MKNRNNTLVLSALLLLADAQTSLRAQLVADGATATINGTSTNIIGTLTVGTNGSFTTLVITNTGTVTNTGNGIIGQNSGALTNRVIVTGAGSIWNIGGSLNFGVVGSYGLLIVTNGGRVENNTGNLPLNGGSGNTAIVTGTNSVWTNRSGLNVGQVGAFHRLFVTNGGTVQSAAQLNVGNVAVSNQLTVVAGGKVFSGNIRLGFTFSSIGNLAVIADTNSECRVGSEVAVGYDSSFNQLFLTNGGKIFSDGAYVGANSVGGSAGRNNLVVIAGAGSTWTNTRPSAVGNSGSFNQLIITNGGVLRNTGSTALGGGLTVGSAASSGSNLVMIAGANSLFSNQGGLNPEFVLGFNGSFNQLQVQHGGVAAIDSGYLGYNIASSNNLAVVADPSSQWVNALRLSVGNAGSFNTLVVSNAGTVAAADLFIGFSDTSSNNLVTVTSGNLIVTNAAGTAALDVRRGTNILNSGNLTADRLLVTNSLGFFEFKNGALSVGNSTVNNGQPFMASRGNILSSTFNLLGNGLHTFNNGLVISNVALQGNGTIVGLVTITPSGRISLVSASATDRLILSNTPSLGGLIFLDLSKDSGVRTNDQIQVAGNLVYGGRMSGNKLGADALTIGDRFQLFSASSYSGAFNVLSLPVLTSELKWSNKLLVDGSVEVVTGSPPVFTSTTQIGTNLVFSVTNGNLGYDYSLLATTNVTLPFSNWTIVASGAFDWFGNVTITTGINPAFPTRFFRLFQFPD